MADNILTKDRTDANIAIAAKDVAGVLVPRNMLVDTAGTDITPLTDTALRATPVPISASSLPLPTGAATQTTVAALLTAAQAIQAAAEALNTKTTSVNTGAVTVTSAPTTAVTAASLPLPTGAATNSAVAALLTDTQLRAAPVPVSGPLTDTQLRASNINTTLAALTYPASTNNSSVAQLGAGASFTGVIETIQNQQSAQISIVCDQAYTVQVQQFIDSGGTQLVSTDTFTRAAGVALNENVTLPGDWFRLVVTNNGGSTTTTLRISTTFGIMSTQPRALTNEGRFPVDSAPPAALLSSYNVAGVITINTVLLTLDCSQYRSVSVQCVSMGTTGAVTPEWSNDNTTWLAATLFTVAGATATTFNAAGLWTLPVAARYLRLRLSTATTAGTTTLSVHRFDDGVQPWLATQPVSGTVTANVTGYPTAAASADALANPTVTKIDATTLLFNGTTWDRQRNNHLVAAEASSAKVASGNGTTQTNFNAAGVFIWVNVTAVTGTTPSLTVRLQWSPDGGTTWLDLDTTNAQTASITGVTTAVLRVYPGITTAANAALNSPLPRTWRLAWTVGGTTPSFTFAVQANYIL